MNDQELLAAVRTLAVGGSVKEVKMFGGVGFMLNGNLLVAVSGRGLLARVGKEAEREALTRPGAALMVMRGRSMSGYIRVGAPALDERAVASWIHLARLFVQTLPKKQSTLRAKPGNAKLSSKTKRGQSKRKR